MPKSSKEQIVVDERRIVTELKKNSKDSIDNIAKACSCSRQKVWRIIKRLEENKTIWGYQAVVDDEKMGVKKYQILLKKSPMPISDQMMDLFLDKDLNKKMEKFGVQFDYSYYTQGYFDWSLCITAPNIISVKKFVEILNSNFEEYISEIQILEVIFPLLTSGFDNPNLDDIKQFFLSK